MLNTDRQLQLIPHRLKQLGQIMDKIPLIILVLPIFAMSISALLAELPTISTTAS